VAVQVSINLKCESWEIQRNLIITLEVKAKFSIKGILSVTEEITNGVETQECPFGMCLFWDK